MAILWCGGEDIDFPNGDAPLPNVVASRRRTTYSRCSITVGNNPYFVKSIVFTPVTSCWFSCQLFSNGGASNTLVGLAQSSTAAAGLYVGTSAAGKLQLYAWNGIAATLLAAEAGITFPGGVLFKFDMQVVNYGASAIVRLYLNGVLLINFVGNATVAGVTAFDQVVIARSASAAFSEGSEFIVADEDTRAFSLLTMAPNAAGTTDDWTGAFTDVNEVTINDATVVTTDTVGLDEQFGLANLPAGSFAVRMVKVVARAANTVGAVNSVGLGVNSGGTVNSGTLQALTASFFPYERFLAQNPVTAANWTQAEIDALQVNLRSGA